MGFSASSRTASKDSAGNVFVDVKDCRLIGSSNLSTKAAQGEELTAGAEDALTLRLANCEDYRPAASCEVLAVSKTALYLVAFRLAARWLAQTSRLA